MVRAHKLFHVMVVGGAALAGCGGVSRREDQPAPGAAQAGTPPVDDTAAAGGTPGAGGASTTGGAPATGGVPTIGGAPAMGSGVTSPSQCEGFGQFHCAALAGSTWTDCSCDASAPATPAACDHPWNFFCDLGNPDTGEYANCHCDTTGSDPAECMSRGTFVALCQSTEPLFGCTCSYIGLK